MLEEVLSLTEWKTVKQILKELGLKNNMSNRRIIREKRYNHNILYGEGVEDYYIVTSNKGYKLTFNWEEFSASIRTERKKSITKLIELNKAENQFHRRNNIQIDI